MLLPPTAAELVGHGAGAELQVREQEEVELKCVIHNARPRPDIIWYLGGEEFVRGEYVNKYFLRFSKYFCNFPKILKVYSPGASAAVEQCGCWSEKYFNHVYCQYCSVMFIIHNLHLFASDIF